MNIEFNQSDLLRVNFMLSEIGNSVNKVLSRTINKTAKNVHTKEIGIVFQRYTLKKARVGEDFEKIKKASTTNLKTKVVSEGDPIGLVQFSATKRKGGLGVKVLKGGSKKLVKRAFKNYKAGTQHAFRRTSQSRYPIVRLTGPRIQDALAQPENQIKINELAKKRLDFNLKHELDYVLSRV